jgi:type II secretory pathway predicted ATPase ExeA
LATDLPILSERSDATVDPRPAPRARAFPRLRRADGDGRDVARIARALRVGSGHVVVTARDVEKAENLVETALVVTAPYRVLRISATTDGLAALAGDVLAFAADGGPSVRRARDKVSSPLGGLIDEARAAARPVVVVVADADLASAKRLESLRIQLDAAPGAIEVVRMVLIGCPVLSRILELPSARGLKSRVGMQVRLAEPGTRRRGRRSLLSRAWPTAKSSIEP